MSSHHVGFIARFLAHMMTNDGSDAGTECWKHRLCPRSPCCMVTEYYILFFSCLAPKIWQWTWNVQEHPDVLCHRELHGDMVTSVLCRVDQPEVPVMVVAGRTLEADISSTITFVRFLVLRPQLRQTLLPLSHLFGLSCWSHACYPRLVR